MDFARLRLAARALRALAKGFCRAGCSALGVGLVIACGGGPELSPPISPVVIGNAVVRPATACMDMRDLDLSRIAGDGSHLTEAAVRRPGDVAVCHVAGVLASSIGFELTMPTSTWRGRYLQLGCEGLCGQIDLRVGAAAGCSMLDRGDFAIATTDMGHKGPYADFGNDPQRRIDFAHRAVHLTSLAAKQIMREYYAVGPRYAYFSGCGAGGRAALMQALRHPDEFDGIIAGAPAMHFVSQNVFYHAWQARSNRDERGRPVLRAERLPILTAGVLAACDGIDGLLDGLIADPRQCRFDASSLACTGASRDDCLTPAEVEAATRLYRGPVDPESQRALTAGGPQPGSEPAWEGVFVPPADSDEIASEWIALDALRYLVFEENPPSDLELSELSFDAASFERAGRLRGLYDAADPDLRDFAAGGGKLVLWHGWSDPHVSPLGTIAYHDAVQRLLGRDRARVMLRLFLFPGMHHCADGEGPSQFDLLTPMVRWVERGEAPEVVVAFQPVGKHEKTGVPEGWRIRPVYAFPRIATYVGEGSPDDPASFEPALGEGGAQVDWLDDGLHAPVPRLDCHARGRRLVCAPAD